MGFGSIDVSRYVTRDFTLVKGQGKNLIKAFASMVNGAEVLDGDLRLSADGRTIEKVNYGSLRLFGNRSVKPGVADNTRIRDLLREAVADYLDGVGARMANGGFDGLTPEKLESLRLQCTDLIGEALFAGDRVTDEEGRLKTGAKPLSRRTVNQIIQLIDDSVNVGPEAFRSMESKMIGRRTQTRTYGGTPWRLVGGEKGLRMSRTQFESMFAEALDVAAKKNPAHRPAFEAQIAHYKKLFDENRTGGELEIYFTGSLDADTIAEKMFQCIEAGIAPEIAGDHRRKPLTGAVGREMHAKLTNLRVLRERVGEIRLAEKVDVSAIRPQDRPAQGAAEDPVRKCVSELLMNEDLEELEWCGFEGGERLGRVLYRNIDVLNAALANVRARAAAGKAKAALPPQTGILAALSNVSPKLADEMEKLLSRLDAKVFKGQAVSKASFFASSQEVFKVLADAKFEDTINFCLREALKNHSVASGILAVLRTVGNGDELTFLAVRSAIEDADDVALRRMFTSGLSDDGISYGGILKGLGPYALKLMQGLDATTIDGERSPLHAEIKEALNAIKGNLPPLDADVIMAELLDYIKSDESIESVKVDGLLSAASIGQTMKCTLRMRGGVEKTVIYKLQRPGVGDEFRREMAKIDALIDRIGSGEEKRFMVADIARVRDTHRMNVGEILPECDFANESTNALMGLKAYSQPPNGDDVRKVTFSTSNGQRFEVMTRSLFGSERLVLRPEHDNEAGRAAAMEAINGCVTNEDFRREEVMQYFMPASATNMFIEVADGQDMSVVLDSLGHDVDEALAKPVDQAKEALQAVKNRTCRAFEALLQLSAEFVHTALVDPGHFVHRDLHLGNLMYDEVSGNITVIDYGRVGQIPDGTAAALREILKIGRAGTARLEGEDRMNCGLRLLSVYRQMLQAGEARDSNEVRRALELTSTPPNNEKLAAALADAFGRPGCCTVGNVLDRFVEALSTVPGLKGLPIPKEVTSFQSAYNRLQSSVRLLQDKIAAINRQLATVQSSDYTNADLDRLVTVFGAGGEFELQNLGYPEVTAKFDDKTDPKNWKVNVTVRDGRLGMVNGTKRENDGTTGFQGTSDGITSSKVLKRMVETAKESQDPRQRFVALSTILQILSEEEHRLEAFDIKKCFDTVKAMEKDLCITKAEADKRYREGKPVDTSVVYKDTSFVFTLDDQGEKNPSQLALAKIRDEKGKILAAMETLKPHCSTKSLYVNAKVQTEILPLVSEDQSAVRFERPAVSHEDIILGFAMRAFGRKEEKIPYVPDLIDRRCRQVKDIVTPWNEFLSPKAEIGFSPYLLAVSDQTMNAQNLKGFSFYELPPNLADIDPDEPWGKDESARELTRTERETYLKFRKVAEDDLRLDLPPVSDRVTLADYRKLLADMDRTLNIHDLHDLEAEEYQLNADGYKERAEKSRQSDLDQIPEMKGLRELRNVKCPSRDDLSNVGLDGLAKKAYEKLASIIKKSKKGCESAKKPTALDYVMAYDQLCKLGLKDSSGIAGVNDIAGVANYILELTKYEEPDVLDDFSGANLWITKHVPKAFDDADFVRKLTTVLDTTIDKATAEKYNKVLKDIQTQEADYDAFDKISEEDIEKGEQSETYDAYIRLLFKQAILQGTTPSAQELIDLVKGVELPPPEEDDDQYESINLMKRDREAAKAFQNADFDRKLPEVLKQTIDKATAEKYNEILKGIPDKAADYDNYASNPDDPCETYDDYIKLLFERTVKPSAEELIDLVKGVKVDYRKGDTLSLPEYLEYVRKVEAKKLNPKDNPTYEDFLDLLPKPEFDPKATMLTDDDQATFNKLLSKAVDYRVPGAVNIQNSVQNRAVTLQDYLNLAQVVSEAGKQQEQKWELGADLQNALTDMARIVKQMPFTMQEATFDPGNFKSCKRFVERFLSFNKEMFVTQQNDKESLYAKIREFNKKQADANRQIALPSKEDWDKLSFFEVRPYLDAYLRGVYPDRDIAKALEVNNCDRASQPLNEQEQEAYRELETLAVNNHLIQQRRPVNQMVDEKPLTYGDLKQLYVKIEDWQRQIPSLEGGNGFDVIVGGVL